MKIQSMFQKNINRDINGVIKVAQDDEQSLVQELGESVRLYDQQELLSLLAQAGFAADYCYGNYTGVPVSADEPRMIFKATKCR